MTTWYKTRSKFVKELPDGTLKRITEHHLVEAESYADAEARTYEEVGEFVRGEFLVSAIDRVNFIDIFEYDAAETDSWWEVKVMYNVEDEDSGCETAVCNTCLVNAPAASLATLRVEDSFVKIVQLFTIEELKRSKIVEIHPAIDDAERERRKMKKKEEDATISDELK